MAGHTCDTFFTWQGAAAEEDAPAEELLAGWLQKQDNQARLLSASRLLPPPLLLLWRCA